jgi:hypothetical protein
MANIRVQFRRGASAIRIDERFVRDPALAEAASDGMRHAVASIETLAPSILPEAKRLIAAFVSSRGTANEARAWIRLESFVAVVDLFVNKARAEGVQLGDLANAPSGSQLHSAAAPTNAR